MNYVIKAFNILENSTLDCRFEAVLPDIKDVIEFMARVCLHEAYDHIKIYPFEKEI